MGQRRCAGKQSLLRSLVLETESLHITKGPHEESIHGAGSAKQVGS